MGNIDNGDTIQATMGKKEDIDAEFIKNLYKHLCKRSSEIYALKRAFGTKPEDDIRSYLAFLTVSEGDYFKPKEEVYFLVSCLYYNCERYTENEREQTYVRFEDLLGRLYKQTESNSTRTAIARLLSSVYDKNGAFITQFVRLAQRAKKEIRIGERLNYGALIYDLKCWNHEGNKVKKRWAERIAG